MDTVNFNNKPVKDLSNVTDKEDLSKISPLLRADVDEEASITTIIDQFVETQDTSNLDSLVIGYWSEEYDLSDTTDMKKMADCLLSHKDKLFALKALFIGDISQEESEVSWIEMIDHSIFINGGDFPLEFYQAKGDGGFLRKPLRSMTLKKLVFITGGLSRDTVEYLMKSDLPNLEHLELWIGSDCYGNVGLSDLKPIIDGVFFPKLRYLGLRNSEFADEIAIELAQSPIVDRLEEIDLSLGAFGDKGAKALAESDSVNKLKKVTLDYHFMTDDGMKALKAAIPQASMEDQEEEDVYDDDDEVYRYITLSE